MCAQDPILLRTREIQLLSDSSVAAIHVVLVVATRPRPLVRFGTHLRSVYFVDSLHGALCSCNVALLVGGVLNIVPFATVFF